MKVAILGAGISGLSCALELEKNGIEPVIYEKRSRIGDPAEYSAIWLRAIPGTAIDQLAYFRTKYNLDLHPLSYLKEIVMISPDKSVNIRGKLGYIVKRGIEIYSLENQLYGKLTSPVKFDNYINIKDIADEYDYIIVATSNNLIPKSLNLWTDTFIAHARIATVLGDFNKSKVEIWFNTEFSKSGFAYLIPNNEKEASLVLIVNGISGRELDYYWTKFLKIEEIKYTILEIKDMERVCGFPSTYKKDNMLFTGNAAGLTDDFIGCGGFNAVESGICAARSILHNLDYNELIKPMSINIKKLHELRKLFNTFDNSDIEAFLGFIGIPGIKQLVYNNPIFKLKYASPIAKLLSNIKSKALI